VSALAAPVAHWLGSERLRAMLVTNGRAGRDRQHQRTFLPGYRNRGRQGQEQHRYSADTSIHAGLTRLYLSTGTHREALNEKRVVSQFGRIHCSAVILRDFSPEGSRAHRHNCRKVHIRRAPDPSQAQDDPIGRGKLKLSPYRKANCPHSRRNNSLGKEREHKPLPRFQGQKDGMFDGGDAS
jgi:hypothetical protein